MWPCSALFGHSQVRGVQPQLSLIGWDTGGTWFLAATERVGAGREMLTHSRCVLQQPQPCWESPARARHSGDHLQEEPARPTPLPPPAWSSSHRPTEGRDQGAGEAEELGSAEEAL